MKTEIVKVKAAGGDDGLGQFHQQQAPATAAAAAPSSSAQPRSPRQPHRLDSWEVPAESQHPAIGALRRAADYLGSSDIPVGFPTETVYGLGADATRSAAVRGIYAAKGRPSDNPLIVHVCDLDMLRALLSPACDSGNGTNSQAVSEEAAEPATTANGMSNSKTSIDDPIPSIYLPLMERFWPGPLTILLPNPQPSRLAPEVTAGLPTFGARMPASPLALTLIRLAGVPLAAPSANASTRPSPTTAHHVLDDLDGRLELILDGGPCGVGVESTVVDGLCDPPAVLRPGGVAIEDLRRCKGWEGVVRAYKDEAELGKSGKSAAPRAPGMKYKHYSPRAKVVLYEAGFGGGAEGDRVREDLDAGRLVVGEDARRPARLGMVRTRSSGDKAGERSVEEYQIEDGTTVLDLHLGRDPKDVAQGLFSALRELDTRTADVICVEGVGDGDDIAAAVMNRLRKAATETR
ncbi:hypothetical protein MCOR27_006524 [Pyricularia oryzae]|uniref:Threonylcarbamoyl-AMP synthase n=2 Tax=Pyricularia TaxID=48558 RepID=A0ABQ8NEF7_PYRGI|nr:hypothetical protein MCOR01_005880 [Pyricularia oryzae]KAI6295286.1 hypothetical protein MCOR33_007792 [Pyricularia grisea]KAH9435109.1 hypothetical protein MCOR02_004066 [Pyricularia oryzae]KAI6255566.1 hypothetical protein MCOR19_007962 [Pyricularia oryzae]KAI6275608.1 hypothetical protein MCOR26_005971 [Pyricularia oryzae]